MKFLAKIRNKELDFGSPYNLARWRDFLKEYEGKYISVGREEVPRSQQQNRYYWAYLRIVGHETGNSPEDLHDFFRQRFLGQREVVIWGKQNNFKIQAPVSTTKLTKTAFGEYLEKIEHLTEVPRPDPELLEGYVPD